MTPNKTPLTGIGNIAVTWNSSGVPTLTAGAVSPPGATFTYQWWSNTGIISGATSSSYTGTADTSYYVTATGTGAYSGTAISLTVTPTRTLLQSIGATTVTWSSSGVPTLTAGAVAPSGATFTYQWWSDNGSGWSSIAGATSSSYIGAENIPYKVVVTGTGAYTGTKESTVTPRRTSLTGIGVITITRNGSTLTLTAGAVSPPGATVTYQWQTYSGSSWSNVTGATSSSCYAAGDTRYRVVVTGTGAYSGTRASDPVDTPTQVTAIGDITKYYSTLYPGAVTPSGATVTYQWQRSERNWFFGWSGWSSWSNIGTGSTCSFTSDGTFTDYRYQLIVTGTGDYYGSATSATYG
ncbi:hypothetical protein SDC9_81629 [bioreactor metagenome]|uniref:Uncharacterized protein n=1 Tax=bioreactor metagenome TaxID=1076179 RepID=A0A644Z3C0_9ZZZZ